MQAKNLALASKRETACQVYEQSVNHVLDADLLECQEQIAGCVVNLAMAGSLAQACWELFTVCMAAHSTRYYASKELALKARLWNSLPVNMAPLL